MLFDFWVLVFWMLTWRSIVFQILYKQDTIRKNYNVEKKKRFYFKYVITVMLSAQQEEELINVRRGLQTLFLAEDGKF